MGLLGNVKKTTTVVITLINTSKSVAFVTTVVITLINTSKSAAFVVSYSRILTHCQLH